MVLWTVARVYHIHYIFAAVVVIDVLGVLEQCKDGMIDSVGLCDFVGMCV